MADIDVIRFPSHRTEHIAVLSKLDFQPKKESESGAWFAFRNINGSIKKPVCASSRDHGVLPKWRKSEEDYHILKACCQQYRMASWGPFIAPLPAPIFRVIASAQWNWHTGKKYQLVADDEAYATVADCNRRSCTGCLLVPQPLLTSTCSLPLPHVPIPLT